MSASTARKSSPGRIFSDVQPSYSDDSTAFPGDVFQRPHHCRADGDDAPAFALRSRDRLCRRRRDGDVLGVKRVVPRVVHRDGLERSRPNFERHRGSLDPVMRKPSRAVPA